MKIVSIGGGPAGLYFSILMKKEHPEYEIKVVERNRPDDTFGFGVVFSDATLGNLADTDPGTYKAITESFAHWENIDTHYKGEVMTSRGHGFSGMSRKKLLKILTDRCQELGVELQFDTHVDNPEDYMDADLVLGADGLNSVVRTHFKEAFQPDIDWRPNRFVWLGSTQPLDAFTFYFKENEHGLWRVHAYQYEEGHSTWIVETTEASWVASGMHEASEDQTIAFLENLFSDELAGHGLMKNRSVWRSFPTVRNEKWSHENVVLIGDSAHTAHFSIGSGTKLALEDAIALAEALEANSEVNEALEAYEAARRPVVDSLQRAAQVSLEWFENTERYMELATEQFCFGLLTRSLRVSHSNLKLRDPEFVEKVDDWFAGSVEDRFGIRIPRDPTPPPAFTPFILKGMMLSNRIVVSPMCQYSAVEGVPNDWHKVHLGSRAVGGAGLLFTEMTSVSPEGRITKGCTGIYNDEQAAAWKGIVDFVHGFSESKIGLQLGHAGRKSSRDLPWDGGGSLEADEAWQNVAPSPIPFRPTDPTPLEAGPAEFKIIPEQYRRATELADKAGFDIVEVHMAHGYLLSSFISPLSNLRKDNYGGSLENRMRFPLEILDVVREAWPKEKPISVRISAVDWVEDGILPEDAVEIAAMLKERGCDIVDVSSGGTVSYSKPAYGRQYQTPFSERIRMQAGIPTIAVGNISSIEDVNSVIAAGRSDLCAIARGHLWDPYFTRHAARELGYELPWPDPYHTMGAYKPPV